MITSIQIFKESLQHNYELYRNTSQEWLINLLTNGYIETIDKEFISLSQDSNSGSEDHYGNCHIIFDEQMIYDQDAIEIDYEDSEFFRQFPNICKHITGFYTEEEYYKNIGYIDAEDANNNHELTWEQYNESFSNEEEVVIPKILYKTGLIKNVIIYKEQILPELLNLLKKFKIKYLINETIDNLSNDITIINKETLEPIDAKEYYIDQVIGILTDQEEIKKFENFTNLQTTDLTYKGTGTGDIIWITAMLKPRNKSAAYPLGELGVLKCKILQTFYGTDKLKQLKQSGHI